VNLRVEWTSSDPNKVAMGTAARLPVNEGRLLAPASEREEPGRAAHLRRIWRGGASTGASLAC